MPFRAWDKPYVSTSLVYWSEITHQSYLKSEQYSNFMGFGRYQILAETLTALTIPMRYCNQFLYGGAADCDVTLPQEGNLGR